jgi:predicted PurR-regulated permease PerM
MLNAPSEPGWVAGRPIESRLLDVLIRAALILALALLCFQVFAPFLTLMVWALILAVAIYPLHQRLARRIGGRQGLAATLIVLLASVVIVAPSAALMGHFADTVRGFVHGLQTNTLHVPPPRPGVESWPLVGPKAHALWTQAHTDLPAVIANLQPKLGDLARSALGMVAGIAGGILGFLAAFIIAGIIMAYGQGGARSADDIFARIVGPERAGEFAKLCTATIRAVAQGVIGVALIQAIVIGVTLMVAGVPFAGVLALVVLVLGIAQIPALLVTVPAIIYIWASGQYTTGPAVVYTIVLGIADNFLKPLMLGRGVDAPMPVILLGALGGMAAAGILGLFVGAVLLALGYQIFMGWVSTPSPPVPVTTDVTTAAPATPATARAAVD